MQARMTGAIALGAMAVAMCVPVQAAGVNRSGPCGGLTDLAPIQDAQVNRLVAQPQAGQCVIRIEADTASALERQQRMLEAIAQIACKGAVTLKPDPQVGLAAEATLPARCALPAGKPLLPTGERFWGRLHNMSFRYPAQAQRDGLQGRTVLRTLVDGTGRVRAAVLATSSGHEVLDEAAVAQTAPWRFEPTRPGLAAPGLSVMPGTVSYNLE